MLVHGAGALLDALLRDLRPPGVLLGELALALRDLLVPFEVADVVLGGLLVAAGLGDAGSGLHPALLLTRAAAAAHHRQGEQGEQHDGDDDEHDQPSLHAAGLPSGRLGSPNAMAHDIDTVLGWRGRTVRGGDGDKIGTFGDLYLDRDTDLPAWGSVQTGLFGRHESFVPLGAVTEDEGGDLVVPYSAEQVKEAPRVDPDVTLTPAEEQALYDHYGQDYATAAPEPLAENEMVRSEEEVRVSEGPMRPKERVRLRKVLVTEHVQQTVPVRKEVVQVETEPPPEGQVEAVEDAGEAPR